jgi:N-acetylglucosamine kinase-like BadF-type ATPase
VGIDAGASHTESVLGVDGDRPGGRWRGGPGAIRPGEEAVAVTRWVEAVAGVLPERSAPAAIVVGAAGAGTDEVRRAAEQMLAQTVGETTRVRVTTDGEIALEAAFPGGQPGIVITAGSGSNAFARDAHGTIRRVGGLGWQIGDEGSGYALGRAALAAVGRALDGRGPLTALAERLTVAAAVEGPEGLAPWARSATPRGIAALARTVAEVAEAGDAVATGLVADAAADLAAHVHALLPHLGNVSPVPVAFNGGLLRPRSVVRNALLRLLRERNEQLALVEVPVDPPVGALHLALALL